MKKYIALLSMLMLVGFGTWHFAFATKTTSETQYNLVSITRGTLENTVSGTGTLSAVGTVEVGSQVSGTIAEIYMDYNDTVKKGQLLAVLDTTLLATSVRDAEANMRRSFAQLELAQDTHQRDLSLHKKGFVSDREFLTVRTDLESAKATYASSEAALIRAQTNLQNAKFYSPIDGTVIERNVEVGQTVAASLQAPTLFVIAEDLAKMEILGLVDESDIGQIKEDLSVRFTVQTYPDKTFDGVVRQIRLQPETVSNVVNYTVVIDANNPQGLLLPGMTTTIDFVVSRVENALLVPNAALKITPTQTMMAHVQTPRNSSTQNRQQTEGEQSENMGRLWITDHSGTMQVVRVKTGVSDGVTTAIEGEGLEAGLQVIKSIVTGSKSAETASASNPLMPGRGTGGPPPF